MCMHIVPNDTEIVERRPMQVVLQEETGRAQVWSSCFRDVIVHWAYQRQLLKPLRGGSKWCRQWSKAGSRHKAGFRRAPVQTSHLKLSQDSMASVRTSTQEVTSWRTGHYGIKATWLRNIIEVDEVQDNCEVRIRPDGLTKVYPKIKLVETYDKLQLHKA